RSVGEDAGRRAVPVVVGGGVEGGAAERADTGGHQEDVIDPLVLIAGGRLELAQALILATRRAADTGQRDAFRVAGGEVGVGPPVRGELVVDERARALVEVAGGDRRGRHVVAGGDQVGHLHALTLTHRRSPGAHAFRGTVSRAR